MFTLNAYGKLNDKFKSWLWLKLIINALSFFFLEKCEFPRQWTGLWFQKGISNSIGISGYTISEKGSCLERSGDKFLIINR